MKKVENPFRTRKKNQLLMSEKNKKQEKKILEKWQKLEVIEIINIQKPAAYYCL